ncbi:unnamed protein product [Bursaphelenchus xylophilus]|uniref:(pine wood nematode) hypothetical protein n=1 Tax=Bursaphelenchus xylophilus TaxID=6326 RepID=A0A1I7S4Q9_BURXY|nr:unnamed protein product [Bursaphelenchus xylophilus]CAG9117310.1 unnamed protein product [Bursaphelenchus xylophilus]
MFRLTSVFLLVVPALGVRSSHNQIRRFSCEYGQEEGPKQCSIELEKTGSDFNDEKASIPPGFECFDRLVNGQNRVYCPLFCETASSAYIIAKRPNNNNKCLRHFNYNVERQESDGQYFLWRSGPCLMQNITFEMGCQFDVFEGALKVDDFVRRAISRVSRH